MMRLQHTVQTPTYSSVFRIVAARLANGTNGKEYKEEIEAKRNFIFACEHSFAHFSMHTTVSTWMKHSLLSATIIFNLRTP